jgi:hypothetical protein
MHRSISKQFIKTFGKRKFHPTIGSFGNPNHSPPSSNKECD